MIKAMYEKQDDIPKEYLALYAEKNGQWELSGIEGIYTQGNIDRIEKGLVKERADHKTTKEKLSKFSGLDSEEVREKLEKYPELEALAEGKDMNDEKIEKIVESRLATKMGPVARELEQLKETNGNLVSENNNFKSTDIKRTIKDNIMEAGLKSNVISTALEDMTMLAQNVFEINESGQVRTKENSGVTPGIDSEVWLTEMQKNRPHWWPESKGGGSQDGKNTGMNGSNPWSKNNWNMTEQGQVIKSEGMEKAQQMARSANSEVGATRPTELAK